MTGPTDALQEVELQSLRDALHSLSPLFSVYTTLFSNFG